MVRAADLLVRGGETVTAGDAALAGGAGGVLPSGGDRPGHDPQGRQRAGGRVAAGFRAAGRAGAAPRRRGDRGDRGRGAGEGPTEEAAAAADHVLPVGHPADAGDDPDAGRLVPRGAGPCRRATDHDRGNTPGDYEYLNSLVLARGPDWRPSSLLEKCFRVQRP